MNITTESVAQIISVTNRGEDKNNKLGVLKMSWYKYKGFPDRQEPTHNLYIKFIY